LDRYEYSAKSTVLWEHNNKFENNSNQNYNKLDLEVYFSKVIHFVGL
jgi:hypothetical protein